LLSLGDAPEATTEMKNYLGGREAKDMPPSVRALYTELQDRMQLEEYTKVRLPRSSSAKFTSKR